MRGSGMHLANRVDNHVWLVEMNHMIAVLSGDEDGPLRKRCQTVLGCQPAAFEDRERSGKGLSMREDDDGQASKLVRHGRRGVQMLQGREVVRSGCILLGVNKPQGLPQGRNSLQQA